MRLSECVSQKPRWTDIERGRSPDLFNQSTIASVKDASSSGLAFPPYDSGVDIWMLDQSFGVALDMLLQELHTRPKRSGASHPLIIGLYSVGRHCTKIFRRIC